MGKEKGGGIKTGEEIVLVILKNEKPNTKPKARKQQPPCNTFLL